MNKSAGMICVHGWHTRSPWIMRKRKKNTNAKGDLVGLIHDSRKEVLKPRKR